MAIEELLDEEAFDPKKLFNEEEYSTLVIKRDGFSNKQNTAADLIEDLMEPNNTRQENEAIFLKIKESNAGEMLVNALKSVKKPSERAILTAACWECGLDFTQHFLFFVDLACSNDFNVALEAITVVENCEGAIDEDSLHKALKMAESSKSPNAHLLEMLVQNIKQRLG
ncbi:MAG: hypothetical protein IT236_15165 [Bacteroidia bacterium]|nr:hypothetical protein [Bacteroidia bacterium]